MPWNIEQSEGPNGKPCLVVSHSDAGGYAIEDVVAALQTFEQDQALKLAARRKALAESADQHQVIVSFVQDASSIYNYALNENRAQKFELHVINSGVMNFLAIISENDRPGGTVMQIDKDTIRLVGDAYHFTAKDPNSDKAKDYEIYFAQRVSASFPVTPYLYRT